MRFNLRQLTPKRISTQIAIIIAVSLIAIHSILTMDFMLMAAWPEMHVAVPGPDDPHDPLVLHHMVLLIDAAPKADRPLLVADIARAFPQLELALADLGIPAASDSRADVLHQHLGRVMSEVRVGVEPADATGAPGALQPPSLTAGRESPGGRPHVAIRLGDGQVVTAGPPSPPPPPPPLVIGHGTIPGPILRALPAMPASDGFGTWGIVILSIASITTVLGLWAARTLRAPLLAFAQAAERFSPDDELAPLPEGGPDEIRTATRALNRLRARIKRLVNDRTRMWAAVGHDLRTPITRLRLRSEFIADTSLRASMLEDLRQMNAMVESVLVFLSEGRSQEPVTMIDVASSLQTICDQFVDTGCDVRYEGPDRLAIRARPIALDRAVTNLVDNAVRYGERAVVHLRVESGAVVIAIEDNGPGIPDPQKNAMLEPFVRGDTARSLDGLSSFGLGLSIAESAVTAEGGKLSLLDRKPHGLIAKIELPRGALAPIGS
jgi:signal transduction histidine kinase